ncbi:hypothetical protein [Halpernia sp.]|uniref:hypothetical protein n=1 Tax=Halpernia sp. TaxID=2782209 RepID=UPI003A8D9928
MKKETTILLAGSFGIFAVLGIIAVRKFLKNKRYKEYYHHFKALQESQSADDGIEYFALR